MDERMKQQILDSGALDLDNLTHFKVGDENTATEFKRLGELRRLYFAKYGKDWLRHFDEDVMGSRDYDTDWSMKMANTAIYDGKLPFILGNGSARVEVPQLYEQRMRELYGDRYDELKHHAPGDERVVKLLLEDVAKTGRWTDMPDEIRTMYEPKK